MSVSFLPMVPATRKCNRMVKIYTYPCLLSVLSRKVVKKHLPSVHGYADDTQLYVSFRPDSFTAQDQAIKAIENCITDVRAWLVSHRLMFNDSKTEFLIIGSWQQLSKVTIASIKVGDCGIQPLEILEILAHDGFITICL